jgi:hypothetical protein
MAIMLNRLPRIIYSLYGGDMNCKVRHSPRVVSSLFPHNENMQTALPCCKQLAWNMFASLPHYRFTPQYDGAVLS